MQYVQPAGQPRLVTMNVNGPLSSGIRYLSSGSRWCSGIGRSSRSAMNGRSGLTTTSWPRRQTSPRMSLKSGCPSGEPPATARGRYVGSCLLEERVDERRPVELAPFEVVDEVAHRQVRLAAQAEVERGKRPQRLHRHRRDVRAEGHRRLRRSAFARNAPYMSDLQRRRR